MASKPNEKAATPDAGHVPMTEELDSAKWSLPPAVPIVIAMVVLGAAIAIYLASSRPAPTSSGAVIGYRAVPIHNVSAKSIAPGSMGTVEGSSEVTDRVIVAISVSITNKTEKTMYVKNAEAQLQPPTGEAMNDDAAPASDVERIFQAYPGLKEGATDPIRPETKIAPNETLKGTIIAGFGVTKEAWDQRKSLKAIVNLYDHAPLVLDVPTSAGSTADLPK